MEQVPAAEQYQVFISHRGPDTKNNLASLIYHNLTSYGLSVFLDKEQLRPGNTLCPAIRGAISSASVHIVIFSPNYAHSNWCLNELCWILKSSHDCKFLPVFYDVEPFELRYSERGCYADAFQKYQQNGRVSMEVVEEWKEALREAADISGLLFKTKDSDYGKFVKEIENIVIEQVKYPLEVATHPVALDQALKDLDAHIQKQGFTKVVGIAGIGGIGKSTLARHIFNSRRSNFSRACYLFNVREKADLTSLQGQLHRDLLGKERVIPNTNIGKTILRISLKGLKILIVFDDVDDGEKIKRVLDMDALEPDSLILITSRDKDILRGSSANTFWYDMKTLKRNHARELFCRHAFRRLNPPEEYEDLVEDILEICGGLPLCLEVLGEQLAVKLDRTYWKQQLRLSFQGQPLTEADTVINSLKWSYKALEIEQQEMLLDVACFFVGEDMELAVRVLEGLGYLRDVRNCLESLRRKRLVDFNSDVESQDSIGNPGQDFEIPKGKYLILPQRSSKIIMQNQVRELARRIVREDLRTTDKPIRLSCPIDLEKLLQLQGGSVSCRIRGICIRKACTSLPELPNNIDMKGISLLVVEHPIDSSWFLRSGISGELVWLRWRNSHCISVPHTISLKKLRVLELQSPTDDLEKFFSSIDAILLGLRELNINAREEGTTSSTLSSAEYFEQRRGGHNFKYFEQGVMPSFSRFLQSVGSLMKNLVKIVLKNITDLQSLPFDCSELRNLRHLDLSGSTHLTTLPNSFSQLCQLQHLALRDCINLDIPMDILGEISTLEHIDFKGCVLLDRLPQGISSQRRLRYLNLLCTRLLELPLNLEPLDMLEHLRIGSPSLEELPDSVACFVHLKELILVNCRRLKHISTRIDQLTCLERLEIYCSNVHILPATITLLKHLKTLTICTCPLNSFALDNNVMDALTDLTLCRTSISDIIIPANACPRLEIVDLSFNFQLQKVQVFQSTLVKLNLDSCSMLSELELVQLKFLNINGCGCLQTLNVENWESLEEIMAERCWILRMREAWSQLQRLNFFSFSQLFIFSDGKSWTMMDGPEYVKEFEKFMLNSSHDVTKIPGTITGTSPLLLKNVHSHSAILMCFLTTDRGNNFQVKFEACNSREQSKVFETARGDGRGGLRLHLYMWTQHSQLFTDEDNFYNNVAISKEGRLDTGMGERGWIVKFASENHVLNFCEQIIEKSFGYSE